MEYLMTKVQAEYGYSDYQIKLIRFILTLILYDVSKALIFLIYYIWRGRLLDYCFALIPMILLRTRMGGIHFKKYWTCFLASFLYLEASITILPVLIPLHDLAVYPVLILCAVINYRIGSVSLKKRPEAEASIAKKIKIQSFQVICLVGIMFFLFHEYQNLDASFWVVVLHTIQLTITKLIKEVKTHEELA